MLSLLKKKSQTENLEEFRDITDDVIESDFVPYACHLDKNTIVTKNGEILQTIKITGFAHERLESAEDDSNLRLKIREAVMKCVDSTKYAVWIHTIRREKNLKTTGEYKRDFSGYLNHFWNDKNDWEHKFVNEVYITVVREGRGVNLLDLDILSRCVFPGASNRYLEGYLERACQDLNGVTEKMLPILNRYGAKLLGVTKRDNRYYSEVCEFLGKLISLRDVEFPLEDVDLSQALTDYDVTFGYNAMEVRMRSDEKRRFGAILTIREYRELAIEALDLLLQIPSEFIISQSFEFMPTRLAIQGYKYQKDVFLTSKAQVLYEKTGLKDIIESDKGKETDFGQHQINIFLLADSIKMMEKGVANAARALAAFGMTPMREDIKAEECYWAQLPANFEFVKRMRPINTARIGGFANLSNLPAGDEQGKHWGPAVTTFYTAARTPYFFNFHNKDNGHTAIIGRAGAGKTVLLNFLLSEARKFNGRLFFFDVDRSSEIFIRSIGGECYNPYPGADTRAYAQIHFNPFALDDTLENRDFLRDWLMSLVRGTHEPELLDICEKAVAATMGLAKEQRHLNACVDCMRELNVSIAGLFIPWVSGKFAGMFTGDKEMTVFGKQVCGFEMSDVLRNPETIVPVVFYLFQRIEAALDGNPAIIVLNEAWDMLDNDFFAPHIAELLDKMRTKNTLVIFATDRVEEISKSRINEVILGKTATQIYLPDSDADEAYEAFGLGNNEISYLAAMNTEDRHFLIKQDGQTVVCELNLTGMADIIAVLSPTLANLIIMEEAIEKNGLAHNKWMPSFLEMI